MGKTRDLFKKMAVIKGTLHAWMAPKRTEMVRTQQKQIEKRWQEYTEELYKKDLHDPDNHDAVITHL